MVALSFVENFPGFALHIPSCIKFLLHIIRRVMAWLKQVLSRSRTSYANVLLQGRTQNTCYMSGGMCRVQTVLALLSLCLAGLSELLCLPCLFSIIPSTSHLLHLPRMLHKRERSFTMTGQSFLFHPYLQARLSTYKIRSLPPCLLYTSPSPRDRQKSRMPSSA